MWEMFPFYPSRFFGRSNNHITKRQIIGKNTKLYHIYDFPSGLDGKDSVSNAEDLVSIPGLGRYLGEGSGCHSSILAWNIPRTEEPGGFSVHGPQRVRCN